MKFYVEIKNKVVKNIIQIQNEEDSSHKKQGLILEDEEYEGKDNPYCVVNISNNGKTAEITAFEDESDAEYDFKDRAFNKFSNWEDYTSADIETILENGVERNGDGSLCLFRAN